jgi:hypothetical protein
MKRRSYVFVAALAAFSVSAVGCTMGPNEDAVSQQEKLETTTQKEIPDSIANQFISGAIDPQHCDLQVSGSSGSESITFTPSSSLSTFLNMSGPIVTSATSPSIKFPLGPFNPTYQFTVTDLMIQDGANQLLLTKGFLHARSRITQLMVHAQEMDSFPAVEAALPSADFSFDPFVVTADIALNNGVFSVASVSVPLPMPSSVNCGVANWCAGLASNVVSMARPRLESELTKLLTTELQKPDVLNALVGALNSFETVQHPAQAGVEGAPSVEPSSLSIVLKSDGSTALDYVVDQLLVPVAPGSCTASIITACGVGVTCSANGATPETALLQRSDDGVTWADVATSWVSGDASHDWVANTSISKDVYHDGTEYFRMCNRNAIGTTCTPAASVVLYATSSCGATGSGGGGSSTPGPYCPAGTGPNCWKHLGHSQT